MLAAYPVVPLAHGQAREHRPDLLRRRGLLRAQRRPGRDARRRRARRSAWSTPWPSSRDRCGERDRRVQLICGTAPAGARARRRRRARRRLDDRGAQRAGGAWRASTPRRCDVIVGTSAGSVLAALLGAGVAVGDLLDHQLGQPVRSGPLAGLQLRPRPRDRRVPAAAAAAADGLARRLLLQAVRHPRSVSPLAAVAVVAADRARVAVRRSGTWSTR